MICCAAACASPSLGPSLSPYDRLSNCSSRPLPVDWHPRMPYLAALAPRKFDDRPGFLTTGARSITTAYQEPSEVRTIGIRREDKNEWESRCPLTPDHVKQLVQKHGLAIVVEPSDRRIFPDEQFQAAGARLERHRGAVHRERSSSSGTIAASRSFSGA